MITAKQASRENKELKSYRSVETQLNQRILIAILWHLENQGKKSLDTRKRETAYILRGCVDI